MVIETASITHTRGLQLHFAYELTAEGVNDAGDGGSVSFADEVEIEHALHCSGLKAAANICQSRSMQAIPAVRTIQNILTCCGRGCDWHEDLRVCSERQNDECCRSQKGLRACCRRLWRELM